MRRTVSSFLALAALCPALLAGAQRPPARCGAVSGSAPVVTRYDELVAGARRTLVVRYDAASRTWMPTPQLAMPLHHASSIDYDGYAWPAAPHDGDTLALVVVAVARTLVEYDARTHVWFFSYRVRVESRAACTPP